MDYSLYLGSAMKAKVTYENCIELLANNLLLDYKQHGNVITHDVVNQHETNLLQFIYRGNKSRYDITEDILTEFEKLKTKYLETLDEQVG